MSSAVKRLLYVASVLLALSLLLVATGCPGPKPAEELSPEAPLGASPGPPAPEAPEPAATAEEAPPPDSFAWTDSPSLASIPGGAITGQINGKPFTAKLVRVKQEDKTFALEIVDKSADKPTDAVSGATGVQLTFSLPEGKPGELVLPVAATKESGKQHAYYWYPQGGDKGPMSVNCPWGCALQITEWTKGTDPQDEYVVGQVKGKVAVVFDDEAKSWVAGTFDCIEMKW
ncbi:MAG: hypothetical protein GX100_07995 [candidate division WS1 bacterium]|jgi:hypothetical protein|nr:hypothetical protein [candidate division WS1 bacterium]